MTEKEKLSPLKLLATIHQEKKPIKVVPKSKVVTDPTLISPVEVSLINAIPPDISTLPPTTIKDSALIINFNINMDPEILKETMSRTTEILSGLANGAAILGSVFTKSKKPEGTIPPVKMPPLPKIKLPKI